MPYHIYDKMKSAAILILLLVLAIVAASGFAFFHFANTAKNTGQNQPPGASLPNVSLPLPVPLPQAPPAASSSSLPSSPLDDIPPLYPQFNWSQPLPVVELQALLYDNRPSEPDQAKWFWATLDLPGQEWTASEIVPCDGNVDPYLVDFPLYYQTQLRDTRGWNDNVEAGGLLLGAILADGPWGSTQGYLKVSGENIRVVAASWQNQSKSSCPLQMVMKVFVSDVIPFNRLDQPTHLRGSPGAGMVVPAP